MKTTMKTKFKTFFSVDSPKAIKAKDYGHLNAINYMAPHKSGSLADHVFNLCGNASPGCIAICLGRESGRAEMMAKGATTNTVRDSRERKARWLMSPDRAACMREMFYHVAKLIKRAREMELTLVVRPNGATDLPWEAMYLEIDAAFAMILSAISGTIIEPGKHTLMSAFPNTQFVDYTKSAKRMFKAMPANYDLTFSRSETNHDDCVRVLAAGKNVAIIFGKPMPADWEGFPVIDGDKHDLRHLDPKGVVVGLKPKGHKAKTDRTGFVIW